MNQLRIIEKINDQKKIIGIYTKTKRATAAFRRVISDQQDNNTEYTLVFCNQNDGVDVGDVLCSADRKEGFTSIHYYWKAISTAYKALDGVR